MIVNNIKPAIIFFLAVFISANCFAQNLNVGTNFYVSPWAVVFVQNGVQVSTGGTLQNKGDMIIEGNLTNNGILNELAMGRYTFKAYYGATSLINGSNPIGFYNAVLDNTGNFKITTAIRIENNLLFSNGYADYGAVLPFVFGLAATHTGLSNGSHIRGVVSKEGEADFIFPIGTGTILKRAAIGGMIGGSASTVFTAEYKPVTPPNPASLAIPLAEISEKEYWNISRSGTGDVYVQVEFTATDYPVAVGNEAALSLAHYNSGSEWQSEGAYDAFTFPSVKSAKPVSSFLPLFTIGSIKPGLLSGNIAQRQIVNRKYNNAVSGKDESYNLISVYPTLATSHINISVKEGIKLQTYSIIDASGRIVEMKTGYNTNSHQVNVSRLSAGNYFIQLQTANGRKTFSFVKQ